MPRARVAMLGIITIAVYRSWLYSFGVLLAPIIADTGWSETAVAEATGSRALPVVISAGIVACGALVVRSSK